MLLTLGSTEPVLQIADVYRYLQDNHNGYHSILLAAYALLLRSAGAVEKLAVEVVQLLIRVSSGSALPFSLLCSLQTDLCCRRNALLAHSPARVDAPLDQS